MKKVFTVLATGIELGCSYEERNTYCTLRLAGSIVRAAAQIQNSDTRTELSPDYCEIYMNNSKIIAP